MSDKTLLQLDHVFVTIDGKEMLHDISFTVSEGEIVTIIGPNGSGKSTLMKALLQSVPITKGLITKKPDVSFGYMPQDIYINPVLPMTVAAFLNLKHQGNKNLSDDDVYEMTGIHHILKHQLFQLSGGEKQRVLLAKALLQNPSVLLLDEPIQGMDVSMQKDFYQLVDTIRKTQTCAIIMVSDDLHMVMRKTDKVICINHHICCTGTPEHVVTTEAYQSIFGSGALEYLSIYRHDHSHDENT